VGLFIYTLRGERCELGISVKALWSGIQERKDSALLIMCLCHDAANQVSDAERREGNGIVHQ
jgi:hypothetical protein